MPLRLENRRRSRALRAGSTSRYCWLPRQVPNPAGVASPRLGDMPGNSRPPVHRAAHRNPGTIGGPVLVKGGDWSPVSAFDISPPWRPAFDNIPSFWTNVVHIEQVEREPVEVRPTVAAPGR